MSCRSSPYLDTIYYLLKSKDEDSLVVSYRFGPNRNDVAIGRNTEREFGGKRLDGRLHGAHDCYGRAGELVVAIEDGLFLDAIDNFLGNTAAIYIQHPKDNPRIVSVYGEVQRNYRKYISKDRPEVKAGQPIAELGITPGGWAMLHFETSDIQLKGVKGLRAEGKLSAGFRSWKVGGTAPKYLLNPTKYLLAVRDQEIERRKLQGGFIGEYKCMFDWDTDIATISEKFLAGTKDENPLTNIIFFRRHRELDERVQLRKDQMAEKEEWLYIRNNMVRPLIQKLKRRRT